MTPDDPLDRLSASIPDESPVDWKRTESELDDATVRALRDLASITEFNRGLQRSPAVLPPVPAEGHPTRWGDHTLLELIGRGATGEVWRSWDATLQREVALKFLQPLDDAANSGSLLNEARALARVRHAGVVSVYGIAEHDGRAGLWMEYLRGPTLAQEIERRGELSTGEVTRLGLALCSALEAVHAAGLVHRDIKPANVILESDGRAVLTDFGLGVRPAFAQSSTLLGFGTPVFMSPETLDGSASTAQSDLYALGATLWWALVGAPPFTATTFRDLRNQAARGPERSLSSIRRGLPQSLATAIEWAMKPAPQDRPRSASELAAKLRLAVDEMNAAERRRRRSRVAIVAAMVLVLVGGATVLFLGRNAPRSWFRGSPSVAVLPLLNLSGDPSLDYFSDGMTEELIGRFAMIGDLRVISRSSVMRFKNTRLPAREVAGQLSVGMILEGSVQRAGDRVRVSTRLVDPPSGRTVWASTYDRSASDVLALHSDVVMAVAHKIDARLTPAERARLERTHEVSSEAHNRYLQGLAAYHSLTADGVGQSIASFRSAAEIDPEYAEPWAGLAYAYDFAVALSLVSQEESSAQALRAARRALDLDPENGPARAILASVQLDYDWDFEAAERGIRAALAAAPGDAEARTELAVTLVQRGRFEEALREAKRAQEADPLSLMTSAIALFPLLEQRRYDEVVRGARNALVMHPDAPWILSVMGMALVLDGKPGDGVVTLERSVRLDRTPSSLGWLGYAYARAGRMDRARTVLAELQRLKETAYVDPYTIGVVHLGLQDRARALDYIEQAGRSHSPEAKLLRVDPVLDPIRSEPRFQSLLGQLRMRN